MKCLTALAAASQLGSLPAPTVAAIARRMFPAVLVEGIGGKTHDVASARHSAEYVADAYVEALHRRANGSTAVLLEAAEHLIREAATAAAVAELYALDRAATNIADHAESHGDDAGDIAARRVLASIRGRRDTLTNTVADALKERAGW